MPLMPSFFARSHLYLACIALTLTTFSPAKAQISRPVGSLLLSEEFKQAKKHGNRIFTFSDGTSVVLEVKNNYLLGASILVSEKLASTQVKGLMSDPTIENSDRAEQRANQNTPIRMAAVQRVSELAGLISGYGDKIQKPLLELLERPEVQISLKEEQGKPMIIMAAPLELQLKSNKGVLRVDLSLHKIDEQIFAKTKNIAPNRTVSPALTLRLFSDFQCPYCQSYESEFLPVLLKMLPKDVRFEFHHFPLESIHSIARSAAEISECASDQGKFWDYKNALFERKIWESWQNGNPNTIFLDIAQKQGLDIDKFKDCIAERSGKEAVDAQIKAGIAAKINGTPSLFVNGYRVMNPSDLKGLNELMNFVRATESDYTKSATSKQGKK